MKAGFTAAILLLLGAGLVHGQAGARERTWLHGRLLDRSRLVVRARFLGTLRLPPSDAEATRFEVLETLKGKTQRTILVAGMGRRSRAFPELEKLLFLDPLRSGRLHRLVDLVDLPRGRGRERLELVKAYLSLPETRRKGADGESSRRLALRGLGMQAPFCQRNGAREFAWCVRAQPGVFQLSDLERMPRLGQRLPVSERARFDGALELLRYHLAGPYGVAAKSFLRSKERSAYLAEAAAFRAARTSKAKLRIIDRMGQKFGVRLRAFFRPLLNDLDSKIADRAAFFLGEFADAPSVFRLAGTLADASAASRRVRIEALGKMLDPAALDSLRPWLTNVELAPVVRTAIARIGGEKARELLQRELDEARAGGDVEGTARLEHLLGDAFRKEELRRRERARGRYGVGGG